MALCRCASAAYRGRRLRHRGGAPPTTDTSSRQGAFALTCFSAPARAPPIKADGTELPHGSGSSPPKSLSAGVGSSAAPVGLTQIFSALMIAKHAITIFLFWVGITSSSFGQSVLVKDGNIFFRDTSGSEKQLTNSGRDEQPILSSDHTEVAFVRMVRRESSGDAGASEIWLANLVDRQPPTRLIGKAIEVNGRRFELFWGPQWSPKADYLYFEILYSSTGSGVLRLTRTTGIIDFIMAAESFQVIQTGPFKGSLLTLERRAAKNPELGIQDWYYLRDANGKEIRLVGKTEAEKEAFFAKVQHR